MARQIHGSPTPLDREVSALLMRIGALAEPLNHVECYQVKRGIGQPHRVVVHLIADEQFDAPAAAEDAPADKV